MAVIKSLNLVFGHLFNGKYCPEMSVAEAIRIIKTSRELHAQVGEIRYVGERETVDVDVQKIKCESCRRDLSIIQMRGERSG